MPVFTTKERLGKKTKLKSASYNLAHMAKQQRQTEFTTRQCVYHSMKLNVQYFDILMHKTIIKSLKHKSFLTCHVGIPNEGPQAVRIQV